MNIETLIHCNRETQNGSQYPCEDCPIYKADEDCCEYGYYYGKEKVAEETVKILENLNNYVSIDEVFEVIEDQINKYDDVKINKALAETIFKINELKVGKKEKKYKHLEQMSLFDYE